MFHYATDLDIWSDWFFPGLDESFGFLWPLVIDRRSSASASTRCGAARDPLLRVLGAVVLFTAVAYLFTPLTAAGEEGEPIAFVWNVRYLAPAAAVGARAASLPARSRAQRRAPATVTLAGLCVLFAATADSLVQWDQGHVKGAIAAGVAVLGRVRGAALAARRPARGALPLAWVAGPRGGGRARRARAPAGGSSATTSSAATRT